MTEYICPVALPAALYERRNGSGLYVYKAA